jgi:hypothetical protein
MTRPSWIWLGAGLAAMTLVATTACDLHAFSRKKSAPGAADTVWVYAEDGSKQCSVNEPAPPIADGAKALESQGIRVLETRKAEDSGMRIQLCGSPTGSLNAFRIERKDLERAKAMGLREKN